VAPAFQIRLNFFAIPAQERIRLLSSSIVAGTVGTPRLLSFYSLKPRNEFVILRLQRHGKAEVVLGVFMAA
jgi:hypothetical protein